MGAARAERLSAERAGLGEEFARRLVETLRAAFGERLVSVVLFGSHARGEAKPESDFDIFLVVKGLAESPLDRIGEVRRPLAGRFRERVAFIAKTPEEVLAGLPSLYLDLALDGRVLYDRAFSARGRQSSGISSRKPGSAGWSAAGNITGSGRPPHGAAGGSTGTGTVHFEEDARRTRRRG